jgi:hypothetical protein
MRVALTAQFLECLDFPQGLKLIIGCLEPRLFDLHLDSNDPRKSLLKVPFLRFQIALDREFRTPTRAGLLLASKFILKRFAGSLQGRGPLQQAEFRTIGCPSDTTHAWQSAYLQNRPCCRHPETRRLPYFLACAHFR